MSGMPSSESTIEESSDWIDRHWPPKGSFLVRLARFVLLVLVSCAALLGGVIYSGYLYLANGLPSIEKLKNYEPPTVTQVFAANGDVIAEFCHERRYVIQLKDMPQALQRAIVAAEPRVPVVSIYGPPNLKKPLVLFGYLGIELYLSRMLARENSPAMSASRTIREALLCDRIVRGLPKEYILFMYANQIYLGSSSYGVEAAARTYFGKSAKDLTIAECAMIAGLHQAPSRLNPKTNMEMALQRRAYVLRQMLEDRKITPAEYDEALHEEPILAPEAENPYSKNAPKFVDSIGAYLKRRFGDDTVYKQGLRVNTSIDLAGAKAAEEEIHKSGQFTPNIESYITKIVDRRGNEIPR
jgi:penicillin-binding protein 1A